MPGVARMEIKVDISHHGGAKGKIECDVADTGAVMIPSDLDTKLIDLGVAGFPTIALTRVATGKVAIAPGDVRFQVLSTVTHDVTVAGFTSCNEDTPCPGGEMCQQNQTLRAVTRVARGAARSGRTRRAPRLRSPGCAPEPTWA
jgi:hypothetical protein